MTSGFLPVRPAGYKKDFEIFGNKKNYQTGIFIADAETLPVFFYHDNTALENITSAKLVKLQTIGNHIAIDENQNILIDTETEISSPEIYITKVSKAGLDFYKSIATFTESPEVGVYYIEFSDGSNIYQTDIFTFDNSLTGVILDDNGRAILDDNGQLIYQD